MLPLYRSSYTFTWPEYHCHFHDCRIILGSVFSFVHSWFLPGASKRFYVGYVRFACVLPNVRIKYTLRGSADKSLAWPGRKQATATKLGIYSSYSPQSSIHFLACCSNFCKPLKKISEGCPSNQVSMAATTSLSDEKWRPFNCFFSPGNRR